MMALAAGQPTVQFKGSNRQTYTIDFGQLDEVVDSLPLVFEMETGVLESPRCLNDRLTYIMNRLLRRDLLL